MAASIWRSSASLKAALAQTPERFDFFQAVRLVEQADADPMSRRSIRDGSLSLHFESNIGFAFAPSDIEAIRGLDGGDRQVTMIVRHLSLAGAFGPLPAAYGERLIEAVRRGDRQVIDFLNIFHHRLTALLVDAKRRARPALVRAAPWRHPLAASLFSLIGLGTKELENRLSFPDRSLLGFAGVLAPRRRSAEAVARLVAGYFRVPARVHPNKGGWRKLAADDITVLGGRGTAQALGQGAVLGSRVWDQAAGIILEIGPLGRDRFASFLPGGSAHPSLCALARFATEDRLDIEVRLSLRPKDFEGSRLGHARLSYSSWLGKPKTAESSSSKRARFQLKMVAD
ncbi:MAG: type VI secretion system baseplate subunit TssG [Geminicoccaceae bacterium]